MEPINLKSKICLCNWAHGAIFRYRNGSTLKLSFSQCSLISFPQLVKTADLDPRHNYVFGFHPHGILVAGAFTNFCTYATGFRQLFPGLTSYLLMLPLWFRAPFFRDYIMCGGLCRGQCTHTGSDSTVSFIQLDFEPRYWVYFIAIIYQKDLRYY